MPLVRYRYRAYPFPGQARALARAFGCARVVFNDCIRLRDETHAAGEELSDTDVQRRVLTLAPATSGDVGVDLGLDRLATLSTGEVVANPRHLRSKQRHLSRAQRALARKRKGSANRRKAVRRVAVLHRKVREARRDQHHTLAA
ncbi:transposase [Frankia sp. AgPm24]|uniref:transposase n=1 Tax=Frankia sp. AgPm24 TaxID=631128 RepID=UPI002010C53D|nr:transposase [Frankia sp. AgPm24]MCK9923222.1 transposase [Frankia sp. AgPm24]